LRLTAMHRLLLRLLPLRLPSKILA